MMSNILRRSIVLTPQCIKNNIAPKQSKNFHKCSQLLSGTKLKPGSTGIDKKSPINWKTVGVTAVLGAGLLGYMYYLKGEKDRKIERETKRQIGKAAIGGKFELVDPQGKLVKSDDFLGQWVMIYFGFTHCPDVCPDELEKLSLVVDKLEKEYNFKVQPIFISVDPTRDTPSAVGKYIKEFSDKFVGLTGSVDQVAKACKAYRVYFSNGPTDVDNDYIVDHTIIIYLINPEGGFVDYFGQTHDAEKIVSSVVLHKVKFEKEQGNSWIPSIKFPTMNQSS